jgi:hypothetical protein
MAGTGAQWFRYGCFGCLGLVAILILACAALFTVAWIGVRSEKVENRTLAPEVSSVALPGEVAGGGGVFVEVAQAELILGPAGPGESLRVEATYDTNTYALEESFAPGGEGEPWSYRLSLRRTSGGGWTDVFKPLLGGSQPHMHLYLPPDVPVDLGVDIEQGGASMRLGGLWLTSTDVDVQQGGLDLRVEEPLHQPVERMSISTAMGGGHLGDLGNASPKKLDLRYSMGGMTIDLRGQWLNDSDITIDGSMGGGSVWLPDDVILEGLDRGGIEAPADPELKPPTLRFTATSAMGELKFID